MKQVFLPALLRSGRRIALKDHLISSYSFEYKMDQVYLPAILPTTLRERWGLRPICWMDPELRGTDAYYPYGLLSYYHWEASRLAFEPDTHLFGDSGGYSVATLNARISAVESLRWQLRFCQVGVLLDVPPYVSTGSSVLGGSASSNWGPALRKTLENLEVALPLYLDARKAGSSFRWWGVVHGETWEQMDEWYGRVSEIYPFTSEGEGWAVKPHPANNAQAVARCLGFIRKHGIKRAHFLQMTGLPAASILFALGPEAGLEYATYDSATPSFMGINRTIILPTRDGTAFHNLSEKFRESGETFARDAMRDWCGCPSCTFLREDLSDHPELGDDGEYWKYRMIFHNTLSLVDILRRRKDMIDEDPKKVLQEILGRDGERDLYGSVLRAFDGRESHIVSLGTPKSLFDFI